MIVNFLTSEGTYIAKQYTPTSQKSYPPINKFTSFSHTITTIEEFFNFIQHYSIQGGCLLKGDLLRPLNNESRAGSTSPDTPTEYIVLDIDRCAPTITSPEEFISTCLPKEFQSVDYIWQYSNSSKITKHCLAGHLIFLLSEPVNVKILKKAIINYNFIYEPLETEIKLSHNGLTLTWGLDPTCAQNDKLIFIAPPILHNIQDPHPDRLILVKREHRFVILDLNKINIPQIDAHCKRKLNELRQQAGLPRKEAKYKLDGHLEILNNPEHAIFRGPYIEARGFRYGNLNNGDSYAYFHPLKNPKYLYNFKGEPTVRLQDIDPDYWRQLQDEQNNTINKNTVYLAFRDRLTDTFYTVIYNKTDDTYEIYGVSNDKKANDFLKINNQPIPECLPLWDVIFEPTENYTIDFNLQKLNLYQKTDFIKQAQKQTPILPKKFGELILHVVGDNPDIRDDFLNWLAFIVQKRTKTQTAYILHGCPGTGKGVLFTKVIQPILGILHCPIISMDDFTSDFNDWIEKSILVVVDEAQIGDDPKKAKKRINKIKNLITEEHNLLKKKYVNTKTIKNYLNFIFTSNVHDSIWINEQDRRFKVAPRQEKALNYSLQDIEELNKELQDITNYLMYYNINEIKVSKITHNEARQALIAAGQSTIDEFISILNAGDLDQLLVYHDEFVNSKNAIFAERYRTIMTEWTIACGSPKNIPVSDLRIIYCYIFNQEISATKFGKILSSKGLKTSVNRYNGKPTRTINITWTVNPETTYVPGEPQICLGATLN